jgi:hypothetical protein
VEVANLSCSATQRRRSKTFARRSVAIFLLNP